MRFFTGLSALSAALFVSAAPINSTLSTETLSKRAGYIQYYDAYMWQKGITAFNAQSLGWNYNSIASWFHTNSAVDNTNSNSWCYYSYADYTPGIAISWSAMVNNAGGDEMKARKMFCGLEVEVIAPSGRTVRAMVVDAFDDAWVRTPNSIDVVYDKFNELLGWTTTNKNDVITDAKWRFTGRRKWQFMFGSSTSLN